MPRKGAASRDGPGGSSGLSSRSQAVQKRNEELQRQLQALMRNKAASGGGLMSTASLAVQERNKELEKKVAELEKRKSFEFRPGPSRSPASNGLSAASAAVHKRNLELEEQLARMEMTSSRKTRDHEQERIPGTRTRKLKTLLRSAQELDLAFLMDATGSMKTFITAVKGLAAEVAIGVHKRFPKANLRVGFAPYRDYTECARDDAEMCDFTDSFDGPESTFVKALSKVRTFSPRDRDTAEDVFSGLERVATLSWSAGTRLLIHVGDAPCHGRQFHGGMVSDRYPGGDVKGRDIGELLHALHHDCQILYYLFVHVNDTTKKMVRVFRKHAPMASQGGWIQEHKLNDMKEFLEVVISASCRCIYVSTRIAGNIESRPGVSKYVAVEVKEEVPRWDSLKEQHATQFRYRVPATLEDLFKIVDTNGSLAIEEMPASTVRIALHPFSDVGAMRWPYHALVHSPGDSASSSHMVVKRSKNSVGGDVSKVHSKEAYCEQMEVQTVAAFMAEHFNRELERLANPLCYKTMEFTTVSVLKVGLMYYNMEKWLEGNWIRYSNNVNYVNTQDYTATLHAFSHWTHQRSNGRLMVTDMQGVQIKGSSGKNVFMLSDPAVHCNHASRYERTRTNWGTAGMISFFETHRCNNICRSLRLKPKSQSFTFKGTGCV